MHPVLGRQQPNIWILSKNNPFPDLRWDWLSFPIELRKVPSSNLGRKQSMLHIPRCFPNNYLAGFSKLSCESRLGFIYDSHFTDDETEDEKRQGHSAREAVRKGRNRSWLPRNCSIIFAPQHIISGQIDFSQNRVDNIPVWIYMHICQSNPIIYSCIFISQTSL